MNFNRVLNGLLAINLLVMAGGVSAQEAQPAPAAPPPNVCEENPEFDHWDFWLGEWKVFTNDEAATHIGNNKISKHYSECLIKEDWVDVQGNGGFSMNFYHPLHGDWRQVWVSNGYFIDYRGGLNDQGQMVLEGKADQYAAGTTTGFRGIWTPEDNGDVIQQFETFDEETGEWTKVFEARYVKQ